MTPNEQTRLAVIIESVAIFGCVPALDSHFLLSLLSKETKRADEAEARTWEEAANLVEVWRGKGYAADYSAMRAKAAAVRRGREGEI